MKRLIVLLIGIIVISNAIWSYVFLRDANANKPSDATIQVYNLSGKGEIWDVVNYQIIVSPSHIHRGHGGLVFKGDPQHIENSTYYGYEIKEINSSGQYQTVYSNIARSTGGPLSILANLDIGSITGEYAYEELKKDRQNYDSSTVTITWNDNKGELHSETINLDIASESKFN